MEIFMKIQKANDYNLKKSDNMNNKLFLVCPFSCMENFIRQKYGDDVFFITALGAVFQFEDVNYTEVLRDFIIRENITEITIVNDKSCRFIKSVLEKEKGFETFSEEVMLTLLIDNYSVIMHNKSLIEQTKALAELNIRRQVKEILANELFLQTIIQENVRIKGLITTKAENKLIELKFNLKEFIK